jgi:hypothetical protein
MNRAYKLKIIPSSIAYKIYTFFVNLSVYNVGSYHFSSRIVEKKECGTLKQNNIPPPKVDYSESSFKPMDKTLNLTPERLAALELMRSSEEYAEKMVR